MSGLAREFWKAFIESPRMFFAPIADALTAGKIHLKVRETRSAEPERPTVAVDLAGEEHQTLVGQAILRNQKLLEELHADGLVFSSGVKIPGIQGGRMSPLLSSGYRLVFTGLGHPLMAEYKHAGHLVYVKQGALDDANANSDEIHRTAAG